jgi:magnesium chelatase family protein
VLACATTFALIGVEAVEVTVEVDIHPGLPAFTIVGLPDAAVQESRERVRTALVNSGFEFPLRRITVNLAPADLRKAGPGFDLALAAALLKASGQVPGDRLRTHALTGELGLDGSVRAVRGALAVADSSRRAGYDGLILPRANAQEAALASGLDVAGVESVEQLAGFLGRSWQPEQATVDPAALLAAHADSGHDFAEVRGHHGLKRAVEVAAAGGHNLLMIGPPGSGKSMVARRMPTVMPPLSLEEALEATRVHSVAGVLGGEPLVRRRPFRAPHHSISSAGLVGGGSTPTPGEASLAHHGVLFLDEIAEFSRPALEALRQPLEQGRILITRQQRSVWFPARFAVVAAMNPCPCGHANDPRRECVCPPGARHRYLSKLSGPLLDRIDIVLRVDPPARNELSAKEGAGSSEIRERVIAARARQQARLAGSRAASNAEMSSAQVRRICRMSAEASDVLYRAYDAVGLSARGHDRVLRVARTLADLDDRDRIERRDVAQAVAYRELHPTEAFMDAAIR